MPNGEEHLTYEEFVRQLEEQMPSERARVTEAQFRKEYVDPAWKDAQEERAREMATLRPSISERFEMFKGGEVGEDVSKDLELLAKEAFRSAHRLAGRLGIEAKLLLDEEAWPPEERLSRYSEYIREAEAELEGRGKASAAEKAIKEEGQEREEEERYLEGQEREEEKLKREARKEKREIEAAKAKVAPPVTVAREPAIRPSAIPVPATPSRMPALGQAQRFPVAQSPAGGLRQRVEQFNKGLFARLSQPTGLQRTEVGRPTEMTRPMIGVGLMEQEAPTELRQYVETRGEQLVEPYRGNVWFWIGPKQRWEESSEAWITQTPQGIFRFAGTGGRTGKVRSKMIGKDIESAFEVAEKGPYPGEVEYLKGRYE